MRCEEFGKGSWARRRRMMVFGAGQGTAVSRLGELRGIYPRVWKWKRLQFTGDCLAGADLYITGNGGWPRYAWDASGRWWQETLTDIDLIDLGLGAKEGRRSSSGWFYFATHIPLRPLLYEALSLARSFFLCWGTCLGGFHLAGIQWGKEGRTTRENKSWEEEEEGGCNYGSDPTARTAGRTGSDWIVGDLVAGTWDLEGHFG